MLPPRFRQLRQTCQAIPQVGLCLRVGAEAEKSRNREVAMRTIGNLKRVARADVAGLQHAEVEAAEAGLVDPFDDLRLAVLIGELKARLPRLRDLYDR